MDVAISYRLLIPAPGIVPIIRLVIVSTSTFTQEAAIDGTRIPWADILLVHTSLGACLMMLVMDQRAATGILLPGHQGQPSAVHRRKIRPERLDQEAGKMLFVNCNTVVGSLGLDESEG